MIAPRAVHLLLACLVLTGCGLIGSAERPAEFSEGSTMARIWERGILTVGVKFDQPLFGYKDPATGRITGFDAEIARLIAKDLTGSERNIRFVEAVSRTREDFIRQGVVDIVIATYSITSERAKLVSFTDPYYYAGQDLLIRRDEKHVNGVADLDGKEVCTARGSTSADRLRFRVPGARLVVVDTYSECLPALISGRITALSTDNSILIGLMMRHPDSLKLVGKPFGMEPYGIGLRKDDTVFRDYLNGLIQRYLADGRWERAFRNTIGIAGAAAEPAKPVVGSSK